MGSGSRSLPFTLLRSMYSTAKLPLAGRESASGCGLRQSRSLVASAFGLLSRSFNFQVSPAGHHSHDLSSSPASFMATPFIQPY